HFSDNRRELIFRDETDAHENVPQRFAGRTLFGVNRNTRIDEDARRHFLGAKLENAARLLVFEREKRIDDFTAPGRHHPTSKYHQTGITPRFFAGRSIFLWRASSRPHAIAFRVSRGSITSSTSPQPATL